MGGQDQWGNIVAGADLVRRIQSKEAFGATFPLIANASGEKFGKTVAGAVWLDEEKTSAYDFYQFWRNIDDEDVGRFLGLFTFIPMDEVGYLGSLDGQLINRAKEILAYEATRITHGKEKAAQAYLAALREFGPSDPEGRVNTSSDITEASDSDVESLPAISLSRSELEKGMSLVSILVLSGLSTGKGEARRLIRGGGAYINDERVESEDRVVNLNDFKDGRVTIRAGKKRHRSVVVE
jgi:tyrosyl-tRNA synthetase